MTVTDVRIPGQRQHGHDDVVTPESRDLAKLEAMLADPDYAGFRTEIRAAIDDLRAISALAA
jgi:hypothetical protein